MIMHEIVDVTTIRQLNDELRRSLDGGMLVLTAGVIGLDQAQQRKILQAIAEYDDFDEANDPYGEHDFGALEVEGERLLFKIEYYDRSLSAHSPDPSDPSVTTRALTIMLAEEY
jgi:hypothetical protein